MKEKLRDYLMSFGIFAFLFVFFAISSLCSLNKGFFKIQVAFGIFAIFFGAFSLRYWSEFWKYWKKIKK